MFRKLIAVVALFLWIFTGCAEKQTYDEQALRFRTDLMKAQECSFKADITADFGDRVYLFSVEARMNDTSAQIQVLSPEEIAGITATVAEDGVSLAYDGVTLELGEMAQGRVSAMAACWVLYECWAGQYIAYSGRDGDLTRVTYLKGYEDAQLTVDTWFDHKGIPVYAEVLYDNVRCLSIEIEAFEF